MTGSPVRPYIRSYDRAHDENWERAVAARALWIVGLAVCLFVGQALFAAQQKSASFDEQYHLTAGYSYLRTGDYRLASTHPPLMGLIAALSLVGRDGIVLPLDHPAWREGNRFRFSDVFVWEVNENGSDLILAARRPLILLGAILVVAIYLWARELYGIRGAMVALFLATLSPTLLGQVRVITTDLGITLFYLLAMWRLWHWLEKERAVELVWFGLFAGLAMAAKYNGLLVWVGALAVMLTARPWRSGRLLHGLAGLFLASFVALLVLWSLYKFDVGTVEIGTWQATVPAPFYWDQLTATFASIVDNNEQQLDFLLGEPGTGWWYYFPVATVVKLPVSLMLLAAGGLVVWVRLRSMWTYASVWVPILPFVALALTGVLTIGFRHLLPAIPFLILMAAGSSLPLAGLYRPYQGWIVAGLCLWFAVASMRIFPHHESYFNELAGDWTAWSTFLVDSNLDWGQDLPALRDAMEELGIDYVNLAYFGKGVPEQYGIRYHPLPSYLRFVTGRELNAYNPYAPEPGWYAISATSLRLGLRSPETVDLYAYFRAQQPVARAGYSIYLYHVEYPRGTKVVPRVLVGIPAMVAEPAILTGTPATRIQVKWMQAGDSTIVVRENFRGVDRVADFQPVRADFGEVMTFLGYARLDEAGELDGQRTILLYWQVGTEQMPMPAPTRGEAISAFVHVTATGTEQIVAQYDGWDVALRGLERGDVIIQRASVPWSPAVQTGDYEVRVGLYSPQDWSRIPVTIAGEVSGSLRVTTWTVKS